MKRFHEDHPVEMIRGLMRPGRTAVKRALAMRAAWLIKRIELDMKTGRRQPEGSFFMRELMAIAIAVEALETSQAAEAA